MCRSLSACVCAHKQQRTKHKLTVFIVSLPALSRRRRRCLCILICFAPLPNADVIAIQSCQCTQRASLSRVFPSPSLLLSPSLSPCLPLFFSIPRTNVLGHFCIFSRALKACNVFLTLHVLPLPLPLRAAGAGAAALATFCLRCQHISFCARAFCCCCLLVFLSSYFPVIQLELDSISPRAESCP